MKLNKHKESHVGRTFIVCLLHVYLLASLCITPFEVQAGWLDKVKESTERAKESWQSSERSCRECGKRVHGRDVCFSCQGKAAKQKARTYEEQTRRSCRECGKRIHGRNKCTSCSYTHMKMTFGRKYDVYAPKIKAAVTDEENQRKAIHAALTTYALYHEGKTRSKRSAIKSINFIASTVTVENAFGERVSLGEYASDEISSEIPGLQGTSIAEDPVECFTMLVLYKDKGYAYKNLKLLKDESDNYLSMQEALYSSSNSDSAMKAVEVMESYSSFKRSLQDLDNVENNTEMLVDKIQSFNLH